MPGAGGAAIVVPVDEPSESPAPEAVTPPAESAVPARAAAPVPAPVPDVPPVPPRNVPVLPNAPVAAADLRASDADRDRVAQVLRQAFEEGRLTIEEHSERIEALYSAKTMGELAPLTFDLPAGARPNLSKSVRPSEPSAEVTYRVASPADRPVENPYLMAVFGGAERKGPGRIGARLRSVAVFGGVEIDLTDATFESPVLYIDAVTVFGSVDVRVPEGVTVRGHGVGIFGGYAVHQQVAEDPDAPVVVVRGAAVFGGVDVRPKKAKKQRSKEL